MFLATTLEKALSLINAAPVGLRKAIVDWLGAGREGQGTIAAAISAAIERLDVNTEAYARSGEVEVHAWAPQVQAIAWPDEDDVDVIETEALEGGLYRAVVSLPVTLTLGFGVELEFSVWDGVDRESIGMGGRTEEVERDEDARVTATIDLRNLGQDGEELDLVEVEVDITSLSVNFGEVDMFKPKDYYDGE